MNGTQFPPPYYPKSYHSQFQFRHRKSYPFNLNRFFKGIRPEHLSYLNPSTKPDDNPPRYLYQKFNKGGDLYHRGLNQYIPMGQGSYFNVFKLPVLITQPNSEKAINWKSKALLILNNPTIRERIKTEQGLKIQQTVQDYFGKYCSRLTRVPRKLKRDVYLQRYYPFTLHDVLRKSTFNSPLTIHDKLTIIIDIAEALGQLHHCGFCQRDVKPDNIFLKKMKGRYRAYLGDFNLAARLGETNSRSQTPYAYWDTTSNQYTNFPTTVTVDLYGFARTTAELFFPNNVDYKFDLKAWTRNPVSWRNQLIKDYAMERLREEGWIGYDVSIKNANDPIWEIKRWLLEGDIFPQLLAEVKALREVFEFVCSLVEKESQFAQDALLYNPKQYAERLFDSPWKSKNQLSKTRKHLEENLKIDRWEPTCHPITPTCSPPYVSPEA